MCSPRTHTSFPFGVVPFSGVVAANHQFTGVDIFFQLRTNVPYAALNKNK